MQSDIVQQLNYIAAVLEANKNKFTVPDHIPAKIKTVREAAAEITRLTEALRAAEEREKALADVVETLYRPLQEAADAMEASGRQLADGVTETIAAARQALAGAKP